MLTDTKLKNLKPAEKAYKVPDRDGMYATVLPSGTISFRCNYRVNGRYETLVLGRYGAGGLSLQEARERLREAKKAQSEGKSPSRLKAQSRHQLATGEPFSVWAERWLVKYKMAESTRDMRRAVYERDLKRPFGNLLLHEITHNELRSVCDASIRAMARDTMDGQLGVLADVGSLAMMHMTYGAEAMSTARSQGITDSARLSFAIQTQAEAAYAKGDVLTFYKKQTEAAIEMGRHEQGNLQAMWDKPAMRDFAKTNAFLIQKFGVSLVRPDIYLGTNPTTDSLRSTDSRSLWIKAPLGSEDLTSLENRVSIARNGFKIIDQIRQSKSGNSFIEYNQDQLGHSKGLAQPIIKKQWGT